MSGSAVAGATSQGGSSTGGSGGAGGTSATGGESGSGGTSSQYANFSTVAQIVQLQCGGSGCHNGDTSPTLYGLSNADLYKTLTTYVSALCGKCVLVKPGAPDESAFYLAQMGLCGSSLSQMPLGCVDNCTPPDYLDGIRQWIANGAPQQ